MKIYAIGIIIPILGVAGCSDSNQNKICNVVDPIRVELGGIRYSIPASYQPRFDHNGGHTSERAKDFYLFTQSYYKDGKRLKYRYCKRDGHKVIDGIGFFLESSNSRRNDGYDTRDAIVKANTPRFDVLEHVSLISIRNVTSSTEWMKIGKFIHGMPLSENGQYYYRDRYEHQHGICERQLISVHPSIFGGRIEASCTSQTINPYTVFWRLYIGADALGKPNGSITIDIKGKSFEEWEPVLRSVKDFIDSMQAERQ